MNRIIFLTFCTLIGTVQLYSQNGSVGINITDPDSSAALDIASSDKGLLVPRVALTDVTDDTNPIVNPAQGLLIWNTNSTTIGGTGTGFYFYQDSVWNPLITADIDSDDQNLNVSGDSLHIENGQGVDLSRLELWDGVVGLDSCYPVTMQDAQYDGSNGAIVAVTNSYWQSFTAVNKGTMESLSWFSGTNLLNNGGILNIFAGIGTGGDLLLTADVNPSFIGWNDIDLLSYGLALQRDSVYTIEIVDTLGTYGWPFKYGDNYKGGRSNRGETADQYFSVKIKGCGSLITNSSNAGLNLLEVDTIFFMDGTYQTTSVQDTDDQTLSLSGSNLTIADGNTVDLSSVNSDGQTLAISGRTLSISGGNNIQLGDSIGTDDQNLNLLGEYLSIEGGNEVKLDLFHEYMIIDRFCGVPYTDIEVTNNGFAVVEEAVQWQEIVADNDGYLSAFEFTNSQSGGTELNGGYLYVRSGFGPDGPLLQKVQIGTYSASTRYTIDLSDGAVHFSAGDSFTVIIEDTVDGYKWGYMPSGIDAYPGAGSNVNDSIDHLFKGFLFHRLLHDPWYPKNSLR